MATYPRPKKSEQEIAALPPLGTTQREAHVRALAGDYTPETLVHLLREAHKRGDAQLFNFVGRQLIGESAAGGNWRAGFCEPIIVNLIKGTPLAADSEARRDFRAACLAEMWIGVQQGFEKKPLWETRFGFTFRQKCIEVLRSFIRRDQVGEDLESDLELTVGEMEDLKTSRKEAALLDRLALLDLIQRLPKQQAIAAMLYWIDGREIQGDEDSVTSVMGISYGAVYRHLRAALKTLKRDFGPRVNKGGTA